MLKLFLAATLSISSLLAVTPAMADDEQADRPLTIAVFGDWPYSQNLLDRADLLINSINNRDFPIVQGALLLFATQFVLVNLLVDVLYTLVDRRITYE